MLTQFIYACNARNVKKLYQIKNKVTPEQEQRKKVQKSLADKAKRMKASDTRYQGGELIGQ